MTGDEVAAASAVLRPDAATAAQAWYKLVTAEREQVERLPNRPRPEDFYGPIATSFVADPRRKDDPLLDAILELGRPDETWIDLGAGGGRYALPIALKAKAVYAIEPSDGMREALSASAAEYGIGNVQVFDERWPCESEVPTADVSFLGHVGYDIADIGPFLDQLESHTTRMCVSVMFRNAPTSEWAPLWRHVHGEERVVLPGLPEFAALLFARGRTPEIRLQTLPPRLYDSRESLQRSARRPVWVLEDTPEDARLAQAVEELAVEVPGGFALNPRGRELAIVTWEPR